MRAEELIEGRPELIAAIRPLLEARNDGDGEFVRFCASARKADRDCNIESPASHYAIMRRAYPYRGENSEPGKDIVGELDTQTRN